MVDETKPVHPVAPRSRWPFTRRQIVAQIIVAAVILASGIGIGVGGTILSLKDRIIRFPPPSPDRRPPNLDDIVGEMRADLSLTDEQAQQVKDTFTQQFEATRAIWKEFAERNRTEREKFVEAMKAVLTPEQFSQWEPEFRERMRHFDRWRPDGFKGRGGRGRPGGRGDFERSDGHRGDHGPRDMKRPEPPPPDGPPPEDPPPDSQPSQ